MSLIALLILIATGFMLLPLWAAHADSSVRSHIVPINVAEAAIEEFFDEQTSGLPDWTVEKLAPSAEIRSMWHLCVASWDQPWTEGPALRMHRPFDIDCTNYDTLILRQNTGKVHVRLAVETDKGLREIACIPETRELKLDLEGANRITGITLEFSAGEQGPFRVEVAWILLQDTDALALYHRQWESFGDQWPKLLVPENGEAPLEPLCGIVATQEEIQELRRKLKAGALPQWEEASRHLQAEWEDARPENDIRGFVGQDARFCRVRDAQRPEFLRGSVHIALWGLVSEQPELVRLAARAALSRAVTGVWDSGFITAFPVNEWNHRSFVQSRVAEEVAMLYDLAGNQLTRAAQLLLLRRLAEKGVGQINHTTWRYEYIHHCNQLPAFSAGRLLAYAVMEHNWPRVKPYADIALDELSASIEGTILADGGFVEGAGYLQYTLQESAQALFYHARARGIPLQDILPERLARTARFVDAILSTDEERCWIAISDGGHGHGSPQATAFMAATLPNSRWVDAYKKTRNMKPNAPMSSMELLLQEHIPADSPPPQAFVHLPEMGVIASQRTLGGYPLKILIMGGKAGAGHTHDDKGSFTLEFAGETFALDPGICKYGHPLTFEYKKAHRHNMLVPIGDERSFHPENPLPQDVKPEGRGDETAFEARIDATPGWEAYKKWDRTWESPTPDTLVIHDTWELAQGTGVEFYWQTRLPVEIQDDAVIITGQRARCILTPPENAAIRLDELETAGEGPQNRIAFTQHATQGNMTVTAKLEGNG